MEKTPHRRHVKVAHIITLLEMGGAQQNTLYTIEHIDRKKFRPVLICGRGAILDEEAGGGTTPTVFINSLARPVNPLRDLLALFEIYFVLKREKPDIAHTHSSKAGILGRIAARMAGVPVIVHTFHGFGFNREQTFWTRALFIRLERLCARLSHALVAVSKSNRDEALALGIGRPGQYRLIRSGVTVRLYGSLTRRPNAPDGIDVPPHAKLVTTIGPFKPQKNLEDFIRAAAKVAKRHPEARFLIVGDGALRPRLESEIARHKLKDVFHLPGWRRDIPHILMRTDVFVLTSLWEGLPRALVEAMASGLPSVSNAVDGVTDVVNDGVTGFLVEPRKPDVTAERICYLLANPQFAMQMGQQARQTIGEEFDIDEMVRRQEELYESLLKSRGEPSHPSKLPSENH